MSLVALIMECLDIRKSKGWSIAGGDCLEDLATEFSDKLAEWLGFATHQDYEAAILGLLAGVGGFASLEPPEAQETVASEAASPNPDPTLFREFAGARVRLSPDRVAALVAGDRAYAPAALEPPKPPESPPAPALTAARGPVFELAPEVPPAPVPAPAVAASPRAGHCPGVRRAPARRPAGGLLPVLRPRRRDALLRAVR